MNDCVCVKQRPGRCQGALNRRVPWQLQRLFQIKLENKDASFIEYWLALPLTTIPDNSGNLDPVSKYVKATKAPAAIALKMFSVGNIVGWAHGIPDIAPCSNTWNGRNERWIVNSHIDLAT